MDKIRLQPRLALLAECVPQGARVADVGTDHGYLPAYLLQSGRVRAAIASDINPDPLARAEQTAREYDVHGMDFRLCAGLDDIRPEEVDTIVIAGMGGETMMEILSNAPWTLEGKHLLILQPQTKIEALRRFLLEHGYEFLRERSVVDKDKRYIVMTLRGGMPQEVSEALCWSGVRMEGDPLWGEYLDAQIARLRRRADGLSAGGRAEEAQTYLRLAQALLKKKEAWADGNGL